MKFDSLRLFVDYYSNIRKYTNKIKLINYLLCKIE